MLTKEEILRIAKQTGHSVYDLLRTSSPVYKEKGEELLHMKDEELANVIASEPTLIKRPIYQIDNTFYVRPDEETLRRILPQS